MLGDYMVNVISQQSNRILGRKKLKDLPQTPVTNIKSSITLASPTQSIAERSEYNNSIGSKSSKTKRKVHLNSRGQKQDTMSMQQLSKDYVPFATTYGKDFQGNTKTQYDIGGKLPQSSMILQQEAAQIQQEGDNKYKDNDEVFKPLTSMVNQQSNPERLVQRSTHSYSSNQSSQVTNILDQIPPNDPIWASVIPELMLKDPTLNIEKLVEDNYDYFCGLIGLLYQERLQKDFTFHNLNMPIQGRKKSMYSWNFKQPEVQNSKEPNISAKFYDSFNKSTNIGFTTQYASSFGPQEILKTENFKPILNSYQRDSSRLTSYNQDFFNWKPGYAEKIKVVYNMSTGNLPFVGKSSYKEGFIKKDCPPAVQEPRKRIGPFAQGNELIFAKSYNSDTFQVPQIYEDKSNKQFENQNLPTSAPVFTRTYRGQFSTSSQKDFNNSQNNAQILNFNNERVWRNRLIKKFQEVRKAVT